MALLLAALLVPSGSASPEPLTFTVEGPVKLTAPSEIQTHPLAVLGRSPAEVTLRTSLAQVCVHEAKFLEARAAGQNVLFPPEQTSSCYRLHDLVLSQVSPDSAGWVGLESPEGILTAQVPSEARMESRALSIVASDETAVRASPESNAPPSEPNYYQRIEERHLWLKTHLSVVMEGGGALKILGPDVKLQARENTSAIETGVSRDEGPFGQQVFRWLYVTFAAGEVAIAAPEVEAAIGEAAAVVDGGIQFRARSEDPDRPATEDIFIDGDLQLRMVPQGKTLTLYVAGTFRETSHAASGARLSAPHASSFPWLLLGIAVAVTGGAAVMLWRKRPAFPRARPSERHAEEPVVGVTDIGAEEIHRQAVAALALGGSEVWPYSARAEYAQEGATTPEDYRAAADLFAKARIEEEDTPALARAQALCHFKAGDYQSAMAGFDAAANADASGDCDRWAALSAIRLGRLDDAEFFLARCFDRQALSEEILGEIVTHEEFARVVQRASIQIALEAARQRLPRPGP